MIDKTTKVLLQKPKFLWLASWLTVTFYEKISKDKFNIQQRLMNGKLLFESSTFSLHFNVQCAYICGNPNYRAMLVDLALIVKYLFSRKVIMLHNCTIRAQTCVCKIVKSAYRLYLFRIPPLSEKKTIMMIWSLKLCIQVQDAGQEFKKIQEMFQTFRDCCIFHKDPNTSIVGLIPCMS